MFFKNRDVQGQDFNLLCEWYAIEWYSLLRSKDKEEILRIGDQCDVLAGEYDLSVVESESLFVEAIGRKLNGIGVFSLLVVCADLLIGYRISDSEQFSPWLQKARKASQNYC